MKILKKIGQWIWKYAQYILGAVILAGIVLAILDALNVINLTV